ncbi:hypothetical protein AciX8_4092 [Granulicella mallensis MP5ACTX8]|uniref:Peptidase MA-like domain-containing protein n=2 Tax=Granulicella mallensis TaxID=940614 RepID=G8NQ39_GRAMM|nr:hypothetical protein AciX8_4092 [Granulicella mallensis MP5ACTX8]
MFVTFRILRTARALGLLWVMAMSIGNSDALGNGPHQPAIAFSQSLAVGSATLQIDFSDGPLDLPRSEIVQRIQTAAQAVATYYGRFPAPRTRILVIPVAGQHGVLQGTTWGNRSGFSAFLRLRIGQSTTREELASDWVITHELVHTALPSLPDDQHWLEEGIASYVEPIARVQAGQLSATRIWADMMQGMPNGEPEPHDRGLDVTHTWGRTYWGGAMFCLMADVEIRKQTGNRRGLQDALRAIVAAGGSIDKEWPLPHVLDIGDQATGTHVLEQMYARWSVTPVPVDLPQLWTQLGVRSTTHGVTFDASAPLAAIRDAITTHLPPKSL